MASRKSSAKAPKSEIKSKAPPRRTKPETAPVPVTAPAAHKLRVPPPPAAKVPMAAEPAGSSAPAGPMGGVEMKKQELLKKVADRVEMRKNQVKPVVEAVLEILGETLGEGRNLNLPDLGKVKQNRVKENPAARVIIAKIRQRKPGADYGKDTVADAAE